MSNQAHLDALIAKHRALDEKIESQSRLPGMDGLKMAELKREKLRLKEEIEQFSSQLQPSAA